MGDTPQSAELDSQPSNGGGGDKSSWQSRLEQIYGNGVDVALVLPSGERESYSTRRLYVSDVDEETNCPVVYAAPPGSEWTFLFSGAESMEAPPPLITVKSDEFQLEVRPHVGQGNPAASPRSRTGLQRQSI
jgi:hypothetical protein